MKSDKEKIDQERLERVHRRVGQLKHQQKKRKQQMIGLGAIAASFVLIVFMAVQMPTFAPNFTTEEIAQTTAAATLIGSGSFSGYVMMGIASFLLGVGVTILLFSMREKQEKPEEFYEF